MTHCKETSVELTEEIEALLPIKGLVLMHQGAVPAGSVVVDLDTGSLIFDLTQAAKNFKDDIILTPDEAEYIENLCRSIISSDSDYQGAFMARMQYIYLAISLPPHRKNLEFPGQIEGEAEQLRQYVLDRIPIS